MRFELSTMKIGFSVRALRESEKILFKKMKKGQQRYISRMQGGGTPSASMMKPGTVVELSNIMNRANFHVCLMSSLRASGGSKTGFACKTLPCATALTSDIALFLLK
jgi:hypothetical protein